MLVGEFVTEAVGGLAGAVVPAHRSWRHRHPAGLAGAAVGGLMTAWVFLDERVRGAEPSNSVAGITRHAPAQLLAERAG
ncbi:hypothetical protein [Lentzea sp. NEAU-D7]|uniref:hypothetical protein n=1 Tax=Lentzea sp. NEAU-D7 TaxID=2994667 RepID=UPI00224A786A|nr:hypothetical protein [Lentzea sp. NEAU-D7]MCX2947175.1 hypothetical protein [Lentzea sp. NEAU-D7]